MVGYLAAPLLTGLPMLVGLVASVVGLVTTRYPDIGWAQTVGNDGRALATGHPLYANPATHYTAMLYGPTTAVLLAPLYRVYWWDGWAMVLSIIATVGLVALVGVLAAARRSGVPVWQQVTAGVGVGFTVLWIVWVSQSAAVFRGKVDELGWLLALGGLCAFVSFAAGRTVRLWPTVVLLTGAVWTKQTTGGALVAVLVVAIWWAWRRALPWRAVHRLVVGLAALNVGVLLALLVATRGWVWFTMFEIAARKYSDPGVLSYLSEATRLLALPVLAVVIIYAASLRGGQSPSRGSRPSVTRLLGFVLVVFVVVELVPAFVGRRQSGGSIDAYLGILWALGMLLALAYRAGWTNTRARMAGTVVFVAIAAVGVVGPVGDVFARENVVTPTVAPRQEVAPINPKVIDFARTHLVWESQLGVVAPKQTSPVAFPAQANLNDVLAAGEPVTYFVDALAQRRFDAVTMIEPLAEGYVAAGGRMNGEYIAALNELIQRGYAARQPGVPGSLLGRRPGSIDLSWAPACFNTPHPAACVAQGH